MKFWHLFVLNGQYCTNHGSFRQLQNAKTVADCPESCKLSDQFKTVTTTDSHSFSQSVSQSVNQLVSQSNSHAILLAITKKNQIPTVTTVPCPYFPYCYTVIYVTSVTTVTTVKTVAQSQYNYRKLQTVNVYYCFFSVRWSVSDPLNGWH